MTHREEFIDWIEGLTRWSTKFDMTFDWNCDEFRAAKLFENWMVQQLPSSTFLFSVERDPNQHKVMNTKQGLNQACHVHAITDTDWHILKKRGIYRKDKWQNWYERYGRCRIEPAKSISAATGYALKKILNYSEKREDHKSHFRKTDVDWNIQWGKGKRAQERRDEASESGQEIIRQANDYTINPNEQLPGPKKRIVRNDEDQEELFPWLKKRRNKT